MKAQKDKKLIEQDLEKYFKKKGFKVSNKTNLIENEILDSMGIFELISYLEKKFSIRISHRLMDAKYFETIEIIRLKIFKVK